MIDCAQSAITNEICEIVAGASSVDADKGGNAKELLAFEYESGDEFEAERIREFADWFKVRRKQGRMAVGGQREILRSGKNLMSTFKTQH